MQQWESTGQTKICLKLSDQSEMTRIADQAADAGLPVYIVCDAGRTQVCPASFGRPWHSNHSPRLIQAARLFLRLVQHSRPRLMVLLDS